MADLVKRYCHEMARKEIRNIPTIPEIDELLNLISGAMAALRRGNVKDLWGYLNEIANTVEIWRETARQFDGRSN